MSGQERPGKLLCLAFILSALICQQLSTDIAPFTGHSFLYFLPIANPTEPGTKRLWGAARSSQCPQTIPRLSLPFAYFSQAFLWNPKMLISGNCARLPLVLQLGQETGGRLWTGIHGPTEAQGLMPPLPSLIWPQGQKLGLKTRPAAIRGIRA